LKKTLHKIVCKVLQFLDQLSKMGKMDDGMVHFHPSHVDKNKNAQIKFIHQCWIMWWWLNFIHYGWKVHVHGQMFQIFNNILLNLHFFLKNPTFSYYHNF
jgi:hypothetical protein